MERMRMFVSVGCCMGGVGRVMWVGEGGGSGGGEEDL